MSYFNLPKLKKLETYPLWKKTSEVVEYMYGKLADFPDEEKWATVTKVRTASNDLLFAVSQALGDSSPTGSEYSWSAVRRHATSLKAIYRFAARQKFIEIEAEIMVKLDEILDLADNEVKDSYDRTKKAYLKEVEFWQKKYAMWKEMSHEN